MKTLRSARSGSRSSLKKNLMPSASVWKMPKGPARLGPSRLLMSAWTLRSNHTMNSTDTSSSTKVMHALQEHDQHLGQADVAGEQRVHREDVAGGSWQHPDVGDGLRRRRSGRRRVAAGLVDERPPTRGARRRRGGRGAPREPRAEETVTVVPAATPTRSKSWGCRRTDRPRRQRRSDGEVCTSVPPS